MVLETLGFVSVGFAVVYGVTRALPDRFPSVLLVRATGPAAALLGGFVMRSVLGPGHPVITLLAAAAVSLALVTLLVRPARAVRSVRAIRGGLANRHRGQGGNGTTRTRHA